VIVVIVVVMNTISRNLTRSKLYDVLRRCRVYV
jgi:hypothetical protein